MNFPGRAPSAHLSPKGDGTIKPSAKPLVGQPKKDWGAKLDDATRKSLVALGNSLDRAVVAGDKPRAKAMLDEIAKFLNELVDSNEKAKSKSAAIIRLKAVIGGSEINADDVFAPFSTALSIECNAGDGNLDINYIGASSFAKKSRPSVEDALIEIAGKIKSYGSRRTGSEAEKATPANVPLQELDKRTMIARTIGGRLIYDGISEHCRSLAKKMAGMREEDTISNVAEADIGELKDLFIRIAKNNEKLSKSGMLAVDSQTGEKACCLNVHALNVSIAVVAGENGTFRFGSRSAEIGMLPKIEMPKLKETVLALAERLAKWDGL